VRAALSLACLDFIDGEPDRLVAQLALHELDVVISDVPASPQLSVRSFTHLLGECGVTFFGTKALARRYRRGFSGSLTGAAVLLPTGNTALRRTLDKWFDDNSIQPRIRGELSDSALLKAFGSVGEGFFVAPSVVERDVQRMEDAAIVGRDASVRERFYAITVDKRLKHPAVVAITQAARTHLFRDDPADGPTA
jgi:LysR family transcriptional activator of nhaA